MRRMDGSLRDRLLTRLTPCPDGDCECLLWTGYVAPNGYGRIGVSQKSRFVHRVAWELENGPIPGGLTIDHVKARGCRHKHCANVAHLEAVTHRENVRRAAPGPRTHCAQGHRLVRVLDGYRRCRECPQPARDPRPYTPYVWRDGHPRWDVQEVAS